MKHAIIWAVICSLSLVCASYPQLKNERHVTKVMTLGVFHFKFPNLDAVKIGDKDKIDVKAPEYRNEIIKLVSVLKKYKPDEIFIEAKSYEQKSIDSLYQAYLRGIHTLSRSEVEQLGFRLAKELNIKRLNCVDTWGRMYRSLDFLLSDTSSRAEKFEKYYFDNPDSVYLKNEGLSFSATRGIVENLFDLNDPDHIKESLGPYLIGHFKYEEKEGDYTGADFEAARWFDRNLRILRNVQRHITKDTRRILVIFGAGHMNILNYLFECSPEFELVSPEPYLKKAL